MTREEAITVLKNTAWLGTEEKLKKVKQAIEALEPKTGKWLQNKDDSAGCGYFICSECKRDFYDTWNFCPNCGADMRGEQDE